jgi:hypothetical protein
MVYRSLMVAGAMLAAAVLWANSAQAQFGMNLPRNDFRWQWSNALENRTLSRDFNARGSEAGFNCDLSGALRPSSRLDRTDIRRLESELGISLFFIQAATRTMNDLDLQRQLDWAVLDCKLPEAREPDAEAQQERLDRLRDRALRRQSQRREQRDRQEAR